MTSSRAPELPGRVHLPPSPLGGSTVGPASGAGGEGVTGMCAKDVSWHSVVPRANNGMPMPMLSMSAVFQKLQPLLFCVSAGIC